MENQNQDAMENLLQSMENWKIKPPESRQQNHLLDSSVPLISQPWDSWPSSGISSLGDGPISPLDKNSSPFRVNFSPLYKASVLFSDERPQSLDPTYGPRSLSPFDRPQSLPPLERPLSISPFEKSQPVSPFAKESPFSHVNKSFKFLPFNRSAESLTTNNQDDLSSYVRKHSGFSIDRVSDNELISDDKVMNPDSNSFKLGYGEPHLFQLASPRSPRLGNQLLKDPRTLSEFDHSNYVQEKPELTSYHPRNSTVIIPEDSENVARNSSLVCMDNTSLSVVPYNLTGISSVVDPDTSKYSLQTKSSDGLNGTQLQDINDSILMEMSGVSAIQDTENSEFSIKEPQQFNEFKIPMIDLFERSKKVNKSTIKETVTDSVAPKPIKEKSLNTRWKSIIGGSHQNLLDEISDSVLHSTCDTEPGFTSQSSSGSSSNQNSRNLGQSIECKEIETCDLYSQVQNSSNREATATSEINTEYNSNAQISMNNQSWNASLEGENSFNNSKQILRPAKLFLPIDENKFNLKSNNISEIETQINSSPLMKPLSQKEHILKNNDKSNSSFNGTNLCLEKGKCESNYNISNEKDPFEELNYNKNGSSQSDAEDENISQVELHDELVQMIHHSHSENIGEPLNNIGLEVNVPPLNLDNGVVSSEEEFIDDQKNLPEIKISCSCSESCNCKQSCSEELKDEKSADNLNSSSDSIESSDDLKDTLSSKGTFKSTGSTTDELLKTVLSRLESTIKSTTSIDETVLINIDTNLTSNTFSPTLVNSPFGVSTFSPTLVNSPFRLSNLHSINSTNPTPFELSIKSPEEAALQTPMEPLRSQHNSGEERTLQSSKKFTFNDVSHTEDKKSIKECSIILDLEGFDVDKFKESNVKRQEANSKILQELQINEEMQPWKKVQEQVEELIGEEINFPKVELDEGTKNVFEIKEPSPPKVFEGFGESDNSFLSAASQASNSPTSSEPYPGDDLVDALFNSCVPDDNGCVMASHLAINLSQALSEQQPRWVVESLKYALLAEGFDANLDLPTYRQMLTTWLYKNANDPSVQALTNISNNGINRKLTTHQFSEEMDEISLEAFTEMKNVTFEEKFVDNCEFLAHLDEFPSNPSTPIRGSQALHDHLRRTIGGQIPSANRRSTLLPWVRNGLGVDIANADSVVMSRPPSPISPGASTTVFTYHHNNSAFTPVDGNSHEESYRVTFDLKPESQRQLNYTYGSLEDEAGTPKLDPGELQHEVAELCHTNKRLHGENAELTTYLTQAEDANCSLRQHCIVLEQDLSSIKVQLADARRLESELEEVRARLESERDEKGELCDRLNHLERDNNNLHERIHELSAQVRHAQEEVETLTVKEECLIQEHQEKVAQLTEEVSYMREQSVFQDKTTQQLNTTILDLKKVTQVLEDERIGLEEQLDIVRGELDMATSMHVTNMQKEIQNITEEDEVIISDPKFTPYQVVFGSGGGLGSARASDKKRLPWVPHLYSTPYHSRLAFMNSDVQTPSIHSEMQALGENNGSLPFCEKSESGSSFQSPFKHNMGGQQEEASKSDTGRKGNVNMSSQRDTNDLQTNLVAMFSRYLSWWQNWEAKGNPLLQGLPGANVRPLQEHLTAHHGELLKLESELQHILKLRGINYSRMINEQRRLSENSIQASDISLRTSVAETTPRRRVPYKSRVRNMVSRFEVIASKEQEASRTKVEDGRFSQSLPCTPVMPRWTTTVKRPASVEGNQRKNIVNDNNQSICDKQQMELESPDPKPIQDRDINSNFKKSPEDLPNHILNEDGDTSMSGVVLRDSIVDIDINISNCQASHSSSNKVESINEVSSLCGEVGLPGLQYGLDCDDDSNSSRSVDTSSGVYQYTVVSVVEEEPTNTGGEDRSLEEINMDLENNEDLSESELYNTSHLMKLMKEVTEQREQINHLREQLTLEEDMREDNYAKLTQLRRLFLEVVHYTYEWTEAVRKEWLTTTTTDAQGGDDDGDEKQDLAKNDFDEDSSKSPQQQTNHRSRQNEQKQLDNDEIELLIRTRCETGCVESQDNLDKDIYLSPETVAVELERELLALKLHVARSHALLHQYQSSSLHGSHSEISTPTNTLHKTGVGGTEVSPGVGECQLCGPGHTTAAKTSSASTATQTPASPTSLSQEDRSEASASGGTTATPGSADEGGSAAAAGGGGPEGAALLLEEPPVTTTFEPLQQGLEQICTVVLKEAPIAEQEEEEEGEETGSVSSSVEMSALTSDHALYCPKPNYEQLDQYSGSSTMVSVSHSGTTSSPSASPRRSSPDDQKQRRTGLAVIANQDNGDVSSESDEAAESDLEESTNDKTTLLARKRPPRLQHTRSPVSSGATASSEHEEAAGGTSSFSSGTPSVDESEIDAFDEDALQKPRSLRALQRGASSVGPISIGTSITTTTPTPADVDTSSSYSSTSNIPIVDATADACSNTTEEQPLSLTNAYQSVEGLQENSNNSNEGFQRGRSVSVFPSLQDNYLRALGLTSDIQGGNENLSESEIENKFSQLSLAFKTDKLTLRQRLDVQRRHRDTAENNMDAEVALLKKTISGLHVECMDSDLADSVSQVGRCLDVLAIAAEGLVTASEDSLHPIYVVRNSNDEVWGAVQQEWRVSLSLEVFLLHVENVKRMYEKDHQELEETKKLLKDYQIPYPPNSNTGNTGNLSPGVSEAAPDASRRIRALSLAGSPRGQGGSNSEVSDRPPRRVSLGAFLKGGTSRRRSSLMPDLGLFREQLSAVAAAAVAANKEKEEAEEKREEMRSIAAGRNNNQYTSITEEGSDSGGSDTETSPSSPSSPSDAISTTTSNTAATDSANTTADLVSTTAAMAKTLEELHPDLFSNIDEHNSCVEDYSIGSPTLSMAADSTSPATPLPLAVSTQQYMQHTCSWVWERAEGVVGWARGGHWPYSPQQTVQGARYVFTSLLLVLAALFLLFTISSGDGDVPEPRHPGWTTIHHVMHPFVSIRRVGAPPT